MLSEYGVDLAAWYAAGRWVALLDLIDMLPSASRLNEAIVNDPDAARDIAALPTPEGEWSPRPSEYTLTHQMLGRLITATEQVGQAVIAGAGGKPQPVKPFPRPVTEVDRAIEHMEREWTEDLLGQFGFDPEDI